MWGALAEAAKSDELVVESIDKLLFAELFTWASALQAAARVLQHQRFCASAHSHLSSALPEQLKRCLP